MHLSFEEIKRYADSSVIFKRGKRLQQHGPYRLISEFPGKDRFIFEVDGS